MERKAIFQLWTVFIYVFFGVVLVGVAGVLTVVPPLGELGAVFGRGQILWFAWIGSFMLRRSQG